MKVIEQPGARARTVSEYLVALSRGTAYYISRAEHRGVLIEILFVARADGKAQMSSEIKSPFDGRPHTRFWRLDQAGSRDEAVQLALRESRELIDRLVNEGAEVGVEESPSGP